MKGLIRNIFATLIGLMLFSLFAMFVLMSMFQEVVPDVPDGAMIVMDLSMPISDKPIVTTPRGMIDEVIYGTPTNSVQLKDLTRALEHAAEDGRIRGLYFHGNVSSGGLMSGWAAMKELRDALKAFKASGKKVYACSSSYGEKDLYLASVADTITIEPLGGAELDGFASEGMFFARAFEKYGIGVQVTRVGKYKAAVEPFLLEEMSPENREQTLNYMGDLYDTFLEELAAERSLEVPILKKLADTTLYFEGEEAVKAGLVDKAVNFDVIFDELKTLTGTDNPEDSFKQISMLDYIDVAKSKTGNSGRPGNIAVIYAEGDIVDGENEAQVGGDTVARLLRKARLDPEIKGVVFRVNSPGGSASASEVILREVALINEKKPIVVSMGTVAASGGYWISTLATEILAQPNTITGSIGVFGMFLNGEKLLDNLGVNVEVVRTADHAGMISRYRSMSEEELALIQRFVDMTYDNFLDRVSQGRGLDREAVHTIAQGRVWSGKDALELKLVDALGGFDDAVTRTAELAGLGEDYSLVFYQEEQSWVDKVLDGLAGNEDDLGEVARLLGSGHGTPTARQSIMRMLRDLAPLDAYNDPRGIYARMPHGWNIR